ncbi:unnamed protein product [Lota lota]
MAVITRGSPNTTFPSSVVDSDGPARRASVGEDDVSLHAAFPASTRPTTWEANDANATSYRQTGTPTPPRPREGPLSSRTWSQVTWTRRTAAFCKILVGAATTTTKKHTFRGFIEMYIPGWDNERSRLTPGPSKGHQPRGDGVVRYTALLQKLDGGRRESGGQKHWTSHTPVAKPGKP